MEKLKEVVITDSIERIASERCKAYLTHALCLDGRCSLVFNGKDSVSTQNASLMNRFLAMLEDGAYRTHREVSYYADILCVTPKYLSEVSKRVSGFAANY